MRCGSAHATSMTAHSAIPRPFSSQTARTQVQDSTPKPAEADTHSAVAPPLLSGSTAAAQSAAAPSRMSARREQLRNEWGFERQR
eukprot:CAMPEP_0180197716 /NCGR_PEP_ID=MMETSP0987-20121128/4779_1 /TAXON_ID=697907 /ORGANISM="non described non described, Strain CCMP2293" /LENGTH=84 /DNA_ID=CAMNT_0022152663 /DNA_START=73 /DNA_END=327 /DNA_ORIENTATION=+